MEVDADGRSVRRSSGAVKGSVWETRRRIDQVQGGIKVFGLDEEDDSVPVRTEQSPSKRAAVKVGRTRKTWKAESFEGPIQILNEKSEEIERSPVELRGWSQLGQDSILKKTDGDKKKEILSRSSDVGKNRILKKSDGNHQKVILSSSGDVGQYGILKRSDGNDQKVILSSSSEVGQFKFGISLGHDAVGGDDSDGDNDEFFDIKEMNMSEQKPKLTTFAAEEKKIRKPKSISSPLIKVQRQSPLKLHTKDHLTPAKSTKKAPSEKTKRQSRVHNLFDLIMWRDVPKSAMVFSFGTSIIIGSSHVMDPNTSFISAISYVGLASIAAIFLYRSFIWRGYVDKDDDSTLREVGEEEVVSLVRLLLPYFNGFIRELKALLSGDPATTMKMAVLLFVLARWGSSITIWNTVKLGFVGAFSVPKLWSLYCNQINEYGNIGARLVGDVLDSLPHKNTIGTGIAVVVLVFSSTVGKIWTVFMLCVASRFHQQCLVKWSSKREVAEKS